MPAILPHCSACSAPIPHADFNVAADTYLCRSCSHVGRLSALFKTHSAADQHFDLAKPPPGAWYRDDGDEVVLGATTRHPIAFFVVPFSIVWIGGSIGGIYGSQIASGKFDLLLSLFGIPFLFGSILLFNAAIMFIFGKTELRIRGSHAVIFTGVASLGIRKKFDASQIRSVSEQLSPHSQRHPAFCIILEGQSRYRFAAGVRDARRYFLLRALQLLFNAPR